MAESLVLLSRDDSLNEALASVVPAEGLTVVADESELIQQLMHEHTGVAFIDAGSLHSGPGAAVQLIQRLHRQLPDIVLVVAGDSATQNELAALVTDGTIYRFVHKPVSAQRVKLFVESAWRKRDGTSGASGLYQTLTLPPPPPPTPVKRSASGVPWPTLAAAVLVVGAALAWFVLHSSHPSAVISSPASAPAVTAPVAPLPTPPAADTAIQAVPAPAAPATKASELDRLATSAEQALMAGNLAEATRLTDAARAVDPEHVRVKFLGAQIAAEQARRTARRQLSAALAEPPAPRTVPPRAATQPSSSAATPVVTGSAPAALTATIASSPATVGPPGSAPPKAEARSGTPVAPLPLVRVHSVEPDFPDFARARDLTGYVNVEFTVLSDGSVANVTVLKSQPAGVFDKSAVAAVRQWRYRPLIRDGVPIEEHAQVRLNFAIK